MAASWHLKDGVYGMIDPQNNPRLAASVFGWGSKYLTGRVMQTESEHPLVEAIAVCRPKGRESGTAHGISNCARSLLLINKSSSPATILVQQMPNNFLASTSKAFYLSHQGVKPITLTTQASNSRLLRLTQSKQAKSFYQDTGGEPSSPLQAVRARVSLTPYSLLLALLN